MTQGPVLCRLAVLAAVLALLAPASAMAWGPTGHRMISDAAMRALPSELPPFLRAESSRTEIAELSRELDRSRGSGLTHDSDRDAAHFLNLTDDQQIVPGFGLADLPETRADYERKLQAAGSDSWKVGYLPLAILDASQQLAKDFAYWRVDRWGADQGGPHAAWYRRDRDARQWLILASIGRLSHLVGDASQPHHVSVHYNGWGNGPNPEYFTQDRVHGPFEGAFVAAEVTPALVAAGMVPFADCACAPVQRTVRYLQQSHAQVLPFFRLWKAGAFQGKATEGRAFAAARLAAGASELRDQVILAWRASAILPVGYPGVGVDQVLAGKTDPYAALYGVD